MSESIKGALAVLLAALAIGAYIATGGDGNDHAEHAQWQQTVTEQGAWVMW